jgi:putative DNA methylase
MNNDRRLIEDYLPIQAISKEASREKSVRKGHISTLHLWWARRPLVACRAAVYGALVPATRFIPENWPDNKKQSLGRANAAKFIERLCKYPGNPTVIKEAQRHILEAHAERLTKETGKKVTVEDIEEGRAPRPKLLDMFAGGGAIPLEALRLGCDAYALDLNPVAHIIELCTLVYPQKFGKPDPNALGMSGPKNEKGETTWGGLANEVRYWGNWVLEKVREEIGDLYPPLPDPGYKGERPEIEFKKGRWVEKGNEPNELEEWAGNNGIPAGYLTPVAYLWTRTVRCKNPSCGATVPLVRQTWLSKKPAGKQSPGRFVGLRTLAHGTESKVRFEVVEATTEKGIGLDLEVGSKAGNATCPFCGTVADSAYVKNEGKAGRIGEQLLSVACRNPRGTGNIFLSEDKSRGFCPTPSDLSSREAELEHIGIVGPTQRIVGKGADQVPVYGMPTFKDLFPRRASVFLLSIAGKIKYEVAEEAKDAGYTEDHAKAIRALLGLALDRVANYLSSLCVWRTNRSCVLPTFSRQALSMVWDYGEMNPFSGTAGDWLESTRWVSEVVEANAEISEPASVSRGSADEASVYVASADAVVTDPPYYDNVIYSDLADFFYVWLRLTIGDLFPEHFGSELTPKKKEAVSASFRHPTRDRARKFYEEMMLRCFKQAHQILKGSGPLVCVYAHKTTLGWATLVDALRTAGFEVAEAWPIDTEMIGGMRTGTAALASSIFLVARKREDSLVGSYEDEVRPELEKIVRERVDSLWQMGITGADLVIAAVGSGLRAFTRFARVEYANGEEAPAERFLAEVEGVVLETILRRLSKEVGGHGSQFGLEGLDPATRFYVLWRYTYKYSTLDAGEAIIFANGTHVELDGPNGLTTGSRALLEKMKGKYKLKDFSDRGDDKKLGVMKENGQPAPMIDALHRSLWLMEKHPGELPGFLQEAQPNREQMRLVAQVLAGPALKGGELAEVSPHAELSALGKLTANWRSVIEDSGLSPAQKKAKDRGQDRLF